MEDIETGIMDVSVLHISRHQLYIKICIQDRQIFLQVIPANSWN